MIDPAVAWLLRLALALLLARACVPKARDLAAFREAVRGYELLPARAVGPGAAALVAVEGALAAALCLPATAPAAALGTAGLIGVYTGAIAWSLARGRRSVDCGCGGPGRPQPIAEWMLVRNGGWMLAAGVAALPTAGRSLSWLDGVTIALGAGVAVAAAVAAEQLAGLLRPARRST